MPPGWAHAVINAGIQQRMVFGAWCDRQYGFDYTGVRAHGGLAYFPIVRSDGTIGWVANPRYQAGGLAERGVRAYPELMLDPHPSLYAQYSVKPEAVEWVSQPRHFAELWRIFEP